MPDAGTSGKPQRPNPLALPDDQRKLVALALELIASCRVSSSIRAAYCRQLNAIIETGRQDGERSLINKLPGHIDRLGPHLYSPTELNFKIDFEEEYEKETLNRARVTARLLTRDFERTNTDMLFGLGVENGLKFGASILKQWVQEEGPSKTPVYHSSLVMPWQFGVLREDINDLSRQSAMCETTMMTLPEVWRRIYHLPDAVGLFTRIKKHAEKGKSGDEFNSFFHQVLSTSTLNTGNTGMSRPVPGGIVQLNNDPNYAIMGPEVAVDMVRFHELWVWDEEDYTTIQIVEPDILVAPLFKKSNLLIGGSNHSGLHPYTMIQPNWVNGYFWGRTEIADLIEPQGLLSTWADDVKRLFGLQLDKILGFNGEGVTDESYDQMRAAGYVNAGPGTTITDLTPRMPPEAVTMLKLLMEIMDMIGGFDGVLGGRGDSGVRSGNQADTLMKMASPRLRDRSLLVERQLAQAADLRLSLMEAKDGKKYWTDAKKKEETEFLLSDIPEDRRVVVDSHSASPIFANDHQQLIGFGLKTGIVGQSYAIDNLPFPNKERLHIELDEREAAKAKLIQEHPELLTQGKKRK